MSALFVDIDGVLNSTSSCFVKLNQPTQEARWAEFSLAREYGLEFPYAVISALRSVNPISVALLNKLLEETKPTLVLSSTHRKYFTEKATFGSPEHLTLLKLYLQAMGVKAESIRDLSVTPELHQMRGREVEAWMRAHEAYGHERYAILDDSADFLPGQPLVLCNPAHGLSFKEFAAASLLLGKEQSSIILG